MTMIHQPTLFDLDETPTEFEREFFPTPPEIAEFAMTCLWRPKTARPLVLDLGAGNGVWGRAAKAARPDAVVVGVDVVQASIPDYDFWFACGIEKFFERIVTRPVRFDLVCSNPPFSCAVQFVRIAYELLKPQAISIFFLRQGIKAGRWRCAHFWPELPPRAETVCARRPSFTGNGRTDPRTDYSLLIWQRDFSGFGTLLPPFDYGERSTWEWSKLWNY